MDLVLRHLVCCDVYIVCSYSQFIVFCHKIKAVLVDHQARQCFLLVFLTLSHSTLFTLLSFCQYMIDSCCRWIWRSATWRLFLTTSSIRWYVIVVSMIAKQQERKSDYFFKFLKVLLLVDLVVNKIIEFLLLCINSNSFSSTWWLCIAWYCCKQVRSFVSSFIFSYLSYRIIIDRGGGGGMMPPPQRGGGFGAPPPGRWQSSLCGSSIQNNSDNKTTTTTIWRRLTSSFFPYLHVSFPLPSTNHSGFQYYYYIA